MRLNECDLDATYSPEDNKLRLYAATRLDAETFARVKAAGFRWAPRQELFVAPAWTPAREDLAIELAGEVGDEDTSLAERAEERAERFDDYSGKRTADAQSAYDGAAAIMDGIPLGQPILVGHHSEKRARKDRERIDNSMRKAVKMWDTASYWTDRAAGALHHAKYKQLPQVRARRIKKLESERRGVVRSFTPSRPDEVINQTPWHCPTCKEYNCQNHPEAKEKVPHVWCGAGRGGYWVVVASLPAIERGSQRWLRHYDNRIAYERAMLGEQGATHLLDKPKRPKLPPLLNYRAEVLETENVWHKGEIIRYRQVETTKAKLSKVYTDYKGTRLSRDRSHRFRTASARQLGFDGGKHGHDYVAVFLTDSKTHEVPSC